MAIEQHVIMTVHDALTLDLIDFLAGQRGHARSYVHGVLASGGKFVIEKSHDSHQIFNYTEVSEEANIEVAY